MAKHAIRSQADNALLAALTRKWDAATLDAYSKSLENRDSGGATPAIAEAFKILDAKAAGLLTHVSMMIAGLGVLAPFLAQHAVEESVIITEIAVYLLIAVGCLRCLSVVRSADHVGDAATLKRHIRRELVIRHELYRLCNRASIVFTVIVFISLPMLLWWKPN